MPNRLPPPLARLFFFGLGEIKRKKEKKETSTVLDISKREGCVAVSLLLELW